MKLLQALLQNRLRPLTFMNYYSISKQNNSKWNYIYSTDLISTNIPCAYKMLANASFRTVPTEHVVI